MNISISVHVTLKLSSLFDCDLAQLILMRKSTQATCILIYLDLQLVKEI